MHIRNIDSWQSIPFTRIHTRIGVVLEQDGPPEPLAKAALRDSSRLTGDDLNRLRAHLKLASPPGRDAGRTALLTLLARHYSGGDELYEALVVADASNLHYSKLLANDPMFEVT